MNLKEFQQGLIRLGYDLGPAGADGVPGRLTQAATIAFKVKNKLSATPTIGPLTVGAMERALGGPMNRPIVPAPAERVPPPVWFIEAERNLTVREVVGKGSNPTIMGWARGLGRRLGFNYTDDDTPWCGLFVAHCIASTLPNEPLPQYPLRALAWANFGVRLGTPTIGAVMVFQREGGGHVAEYAGEDANNFLVLGGNQSNQVSRTWIAKSRCVAMRWPSTAKAPTTGRVIVDRNGAVISRNEA